MSYTRRIGVEVSAKLWYEIYYDVLTATVDILPQTSLDPDTLITSDQLLPFEIDKVVFDITITEDGIDSIGIIKVLDDPVVTSTDTTFVVSKPETDIVTAPDNFNRVFDTDRQFTNSVVLGSNINRIFNAAREFTDAPTAIDNTTLTAGKANADAVVTASSLERVFNSDRQLIDTATTAVDIAFGVSTGISDSTSIVSDFDRIFNAAREFTDAPTTAATIEELGVGLSKVDNVVISEVFNVGFLVNRAFSDSTVVVDSSSLVVGLAPILDSASVTDTTTALLNKPLADILSSSGVVTGIDMTKLLTNTTTVGDIISFEVVTDRAFSDTLLVGDTSNLVAGKPVGDQASASDTTLNTLTKSNSDTVITTEDVALEYTAAPPLLGTYMLNGEMLG